MKRMCYFIILAYLLCVSMASVSAYTIDRGSYYYNGSVNYVDNIEDTYEKGINGAIISSSGASACDYGWIADGADPCDIVYSNLFSSKGTYSLKSVNGRNTGLLTSDSNFNGTIKFMLYVDASSIKMLPTVFSSNSSSVSGEMRLEIWSDVSTTNYSYYEPNNATHYVCDINQIQIITNSWVEFMWSYNGTTSNITGYINKQPCHKWTGMNGLGKIWPFREATSNGFYIDEFMVFNGTETPNSTKPTNSTINISFFDESNNKLIYGEPITISLISTYSSFNYTTSTGSINFSIPYDFLTFRYSASGFLERFYFINFTNSSSHNLNLYMVNGTSGEVITATIYNYNNDLLEDAYISVMRYDLISNTYKLVEAAKTNFEGITKLHLIRNSEYYKFIIYYPSSVVRQTTNPTYVYDTSIVFQIPSSGNIAGNYMTTLGVTHTLAYSNTSNQFTYSYTDPSSSITSSCLKVKKIENGVNSTVATTCLSTTSGVISIPVTKANNTVYTAYSYVTLNGNDYLIDNAVYESPQFDNNPNEIIGLLGVILLTMMFAFVIKWNIELAIVLIPMPMVLASFMHLINISSSIAIGIEIAAIIMAVLLNKVID